jgi:hypothetical protein
MVSVQKLGVFSLKVVRTPTRDDVHSPLLDRIHPEPRKLVVQQVLAVLRFDQRRKLVDLPHN